MSRKFPEAAMPQANWHRRATVLAGALILAACSGGGGGGTTSPPPPPAQTFPTGPVSAASPFSAGCGGTGGTLYINAEVEPHIAVNPANPGHFLGAWQQDRWSNGSSRGVVTAASLDGGFTWTLSAPRFSQCAGGGYQRASDPWVTFSPDGTAYAMALASSGGTFQAGATNAMLSADGGRTWGDPVPLISDSARFFNDKNTITADPADSRFVYAAWDRLQDTGGGPAYFVRTVDGGATWEAPRAIYDPGANSQTIGNAIVVLSNGTLVNVFTRIDAPPGQAQAAFVSAMRSTDRGQTWSAPVRVAELLSIGARDPETGHAIRDGAILAQAAAGPGGSLAVVWQDSRFSGGARDGIAFSRSLDGGLTWSAPVRVNSSAAFDAFTPSVHVRADGTIGVAYFDLRDNTASATTLPAGYWLARSADGVLWTETRIAGPFDLAIAPDAGGYFLGDYMGLASSGASFLSLHARTTGDLTNRTDIYASLPAGGAGSQHAAAKATAGEPSTALRAKVGENIARALERRVPGWAALRASARPAP
jgi:hypothetical protein